MHGMPDSRTLGSVHRNELMWQPPNPCSASAHCQWKKGSNKTIYEPKQPVSIEQPTSFLCLMPFTGHWPEV